MNCLIKIKEFFQGSTYNKQEYEVTMSKQMILDSLPLIALFSFFLFKGQILGLFLGFKNVSPEKMQKLQVLRGGKVIDVRTEGEYFSGHLSSAMNIPLGTVKEAVLAKNISKDTPLYIICASGNRSTWASVSLRLAGYKNVYNVSGGMMRARNLPTT
ncbi:MAG: rhodanese-like domain-containing protein [Deltaproteobacteria bacterium]|nr:MAG: rhodanese-like domain-containing protein [Deltaproteobacteria bacterium]